MKYRSETMKEVLMLFGVAVIFIVIAYFVGLPTVCIRLNLNGSSYSDLQSSPSASRWAVL